jgi:hypothetical protein
MGNSDSWRAARAESVRFDAGDMLVVLDGGRAVRVPLSWFPTLHDASSSALESFRLIDGGEFVTWEPYVDERLSIPYLALAAMVRGTDSGD